MKTELQIPVDRSLYKQIKEKLRGNKLPIKKINIDSIFQNANKDEEIIKELNLFAKSNDLVVKFIPYDAKKYQID